MQCPEHEGLHGRPILQTEMAGAGGSKHAGDPIELLPPPAGEPLQLRRIEEAILSRVHTGLLLAAGEILRARDVGLAVPEAATSPASRTSKSVTSPLAAIATASAAVRRLADEPPKRLNMMYPFRGFG